MKIVKLDAGELRHVVALLGEAAEYTGAYSLRVGIDEDGVKFKVNEWTWSPGYGQVEK